MTAGTSADAVSAHFGDIRREKCLGAAAVQYRHCRHWSCRTAKGHSHDAPWAVRCEHAAGPYLTASFHEVARTGLCLVRGGSARSPSISGSYLRIALAHKVRQPPVAQKLFVWWKRVVHNTLISAQNCLWPHGEGQIHLFSSLKLQVAGGTHGRTKPTHEVYGPLPSVKDSLRPCNAEGLRVLRGLSPPRSSSPVAVDLEVQGFKSKCMLMPITGRPTSKSAVTCDSQCSQQYRRQESQKRVITAWLSGCWPRMHYADPLFLEDCRQVLIQACAETRRRSGVAELLCQLGGAPVTAIEAAP